MKKRTDIKDVAARAGVSLSTVSRVLNNRTENHMRPETREKVLKAIRDLNYAPVKAAQTLRRVRTKMLGIVLPDITNLYFALLARGIESVAYEQGFTTLICDSNHQPEREIQYMDMLRSEDVEGIIFVPVGTVDDNSLTAALNQGNFGGHSDWRLPTIKELHSIVDYGSRPAIDTDYFLNTVTNTSSNYWSSTTNANNADLAWLVDFYYGYDYSYDKVIDDYVRAVRGGQSRLPGNLFISAPVQGALSLVQAGRVQKGHLQAGLVEHRCGLSQMKGIQAAVGSKIPIVKHNGAAQQIAGLS